MRLWVDDERKVPSGGAWESALTSAQAITLLQGAVERSVVLEEVSLDHDLGGDDTGMKVLDWMIQNQVWPKTLTIHTQNPVGRTNLTRAANAEAPPEVEIWIKTW